MNIIINNMDRCSADGFVECVHWTVTKTVGEHTASQYGTESFKHEEGHAFAPYESLTPEQVKQWLIDRWGNDGMEAKEIALEAQIQNMIAPSIMSGVPW